MISNASPSKDQGVWRQLLDNPYIFGLSAFASLGGFLFGYDQGVVSGVLTMESFGAAFPRVYADSGIKGWFVSTLLLAAWLGSLANGVVADGLGRRGAVLAAVCVFTLGSALQAAARATATLFAGRAVAGLAVGMLTATVPMYVSEVAPAPVRGTLVVLQQLSITLGILVSYWLEYGTQYIGGVRCAPDVPYSGGGDPADRTFDPWRDVGPAPGPRCPGGQSEAAWRLPLALQVLPALVLGAGMLLLFPESPRYHLLRGRDDAALRSLARLRRVGPHDSSPRLREEYLAIKAEVLLDEAVARERFPGRSGASLYLARCGGLVATGPARRRLAVGCLVGFFQQFMGCNALIYYAPGIFAQLGLARGATSLLATGVYGVVNALSTLPALLLIDRLGRRPLLMCGAAGTCASLTIVGALLAVYGGRLRDHPAAGWVGVAFVYLYDVNFSYSFAPIGWVLPSEIFSLGDRSRAMAITTSCTWMCNFVIGLVTPGMLDSLGWGTHIFFAAFCFLAFFFTYFFVPETKGRSLEDMDAVFGDAAAHEEKQRLLGIAASLGLTASTLTPEKVDTATGETLQSPQAI